MHFFFLLLQISLLYVNNNDNNNNDLLIIGYFFQEWLRMEQVRLENIRKEKKKAKQLRKQLKIERRKRRENGEDWEAFTRKGRQRLSIGPGDQHRASIFQDVAELRKQRTYRSTSFHEDAFLTTSADDTADFASTTLSSVSQTLSKNVIKKREDNDADSVTHSENQSQQQVYFTFN